MQADTFTLNTTFIEDELCSNCLALKSCIYSKRRKSLFLSHDHNNKCMDDVPLNDLIKLLTYLSLSILYHDTIWFISKP